jgi:hypothetical protein
VAAADVPSTVESVRRTGGDGARYRFLINHDGAEAVVAASGTDLLAGADHTGEVRIPGRGVVVLREAG